jgi:hypothetical protein
MGGWATQQAQWVAAAGRRTDIARTLNDEVGMADTRRVGAWTRRARRIGVLKTVLAAAAGAGACGDTSGPAVSIPDALVATWEATPACAACNFTLRSLANPQDTLNVVHQLMLSVEMRIGATGSFRLAYGGAANEGTVRADGAMLVVRDRNGVTDTLDYVLRDGFLDVQLRRVWEVIDFDGDQVPDPSRASGRFRRR